MRTIIHMSDLHFGRTDPAVVTAVRETARRLEPDLIVVSGDLTQRARAHEFIAARAFLDTFPAPKLVVPGNHDVPLYNVVARFLQPLRLYRKYIADDIQPVFLDDEMAIVGISTARSLTWKGGRINRDQVRRARELFFNTAPMRIRILVSHHPFDFRPDSNDLVGRATMAISAWREYPPDLFLAGHLHLHAAGTTTLQRNDGPSSIVVQAGTSTSSRVRGEQNSFNLIRVNRDRIEVGRYLWNGPNKCFDLEPPTRFLKTASGWRIAGAPA
jgi:3',5'-cyclic AMP phosphodiesterase CpdA